MIEKQLIQAMAKLWVENGGDLEGYSYSFRKIYDEIDKIIDSRDVHNGCDESRGEPLREST